MYICLCKGITDSALKGLEQQNLGSDEIASRLGMDGEDCCGKCLRKITSLTWQDASSSSRCR